MLQPMRLERVPRLPLWFSVVCLLFSSAVSVGTFAHLGELELFCSVERAEGENVNYGLGVALVGGLIGPLLILFTRDTPCVLARVLFLGAATLGVALVLVAIDSASFTATRSCGLIFPETSTVDERLDYLFILWGVPLVVLLWTARERGTVESR